MAAAWYNYLRNGETEMMTTSPVIPESARRYTPADVIQQHATLAEAHRHPKPSLTRYTAYFMDDVVKRRGRESAIAMFHPASGSDPLKAAEDWLHRVGDDLRQAVTFQVTRDMSDAVTAMYRKSTAAGSHVIHADELPAPAGFLWLDRPADMLDRKGRVVRHRAISWATIPVTAGDGVTKQGLRLIFWSDARIPDEWTDETSESRARWRDPAFLTRVEDEIGRLQLGHSQVIPFDEEFTYPDLGPADDHMAWLHVMFMVMETEIVARRRHGLPTPVRARVRKHLAGTGVTVITLRRVAHSSEASPGQHEVDWSCRWVVQGHYRHIDGAERHPGAPLDSDRRECAVCAHRLAWIPAHVKGPDGKPVKTSVDTVYRLSR
jgi:hypothetical protein